MPYLTGTDNTRGSGNKDQGQGQQRWTPVIEAKKKRWTPERGEAKMDSSDRGKKGKYEG